MANTIAYIYEAIDRFTPVAERINRSLKQIGQSAKHLNSRFRGLQESSERLGRSLSLRLTAPLALVGIYSIKTAANFEQLEISFGAFMQAIGGKATGSEFFKKLQLFTAHTPFRLMKMSEAARYVLTIPGITEKKMFPLLKILGDAAATTASDITGIAYAYREVNEYGHFTARQARMFAAKGIDVYAVLAKHFHKTEQQIRKLGQRGAITAKLFDRAFASMDEKGGLFYKHMQKQMQSIKGQWTTFLDYIQMAANQLGLMIFKTLHLHQAIKIAIAGLKRFVDGFQEWVKFHPILAKIIVYLGLFLTALGPILIVLGSIAFLFGVMGAGLAIIFAPITLAIVAVTALTAAAVYLYNKFKLVRDVVHEIYAYLKELGREAIAPIMPFIAVAHRIKNYMEARKLQHPDMPSGMATSSMGLKEDLFGSKKATADVNVHIKDPGGHVSKVTSLSKNLGIFNVGYNMIGATS